MEILPWKEPPELQNRPIWGGDTLTCWCGDTATTASDAVTDMHGRYWDVPGVNAKHISYKLTFQWATTEAETRRRRRPATDAADAGRDSSTRPGGRSPSSIIPWAASRAMPEITSSAAPSPTRMTIGNERFQGFALGIVYCVIGEVG